MKWAKIVISSSFYISLQKRLSPFFCVKSMCFTPSPASLQLKNFLADRHLHTPIDHHNLVQDGVSDVALHHLGVGISVEG